MSEVSDAKRQKWVIVAVLAVVLLGGAYQAWQQSQPRDGKVSGTIKQIDVTRRIASLEFAHPRTGQTITVTGEILPQCEVLVDGQHVGLEALRAGDRATVTGRISRFPSVRLAATSISVRHAVTTMPAGNSAASQPASDSGREGV